MIQLLLGELPVQSGKCVINGTISYAAQKVTFFIIFDIANRVNYFKICIDVIAGVAVFWNCTKQYSIRTIVRQKALQ